MKVAFHTLGCKLNSAETSSIERRCIERGHTVVAFGSAADVCVINTCTVTDRADRECRQIIRRAKRASPGARIIVTGCYAQLEPDRVAAIEGVDLVLGTREKSRLADHLEVAGAHGCTRVAVTPAAGGEEFEPAFSSDTGDRTRAVLKIQDGCDYPCTYCTIPLARGRSRSQTIADCIAQAHLLAGRGYREIVLTGVNVGDFRSPDGDFPTLLGAMETIPGIDRVRISSIEPNLLSEEIIDRVAGSSVLCDHFHLPLQSGADAVLRRMKRRYTSADYREVIAKVRSRIPDCGIGADVIVGFPGETDELFEETLSFLESLPVSYLHVFTYSERAHTPAAEFHPVVPRAVRRERNAVLRALGERKRKEFHRSLLGKRVPVLTEGTVGSGLRFGLTEQYCRVGVPADAAPENAVIHVDIIRAAEDHCVGRPVEMER